MRGNITYSKRGKISKARLSFGLISTLLLMLSVLGLTSYACATSTFSVTDYKLVTDMYYDATNDDGSGTTPWLQENPLKALLSDASVDKTGLDLKKLYDSNTTFKDAIDAAIKQAKDIPVAKEISVSSFNWDAITEVSSVSPTPSDGPVASVVTGSGDDSWNINVLSSAEQGDTATITAAVSEGNFTCEYTVIDPTPHNVTLTFDPDGGYWDAGHTDQETKTETLASGNPFVRPSYLNSLNKPGFVQNGWIDQNGNPVTIPAIVPNQDTTYKAEWRPDTEAGETSNNQQDAVIDGNSETCELTSFDFSSWQGKVTASYSINFEASAQDQDKNAIDAALPNSFASTYGAEEAVMSDNVLLKAKGTYAVSASDSSYADNLGFSYSITEDEDPHSLSFSVKPQEMQQSKSLMFSFSFNNKVLLTTHAVMFSETAKKPVTFNYDELDCRPEAEEVNYFSAQLNNNSSWDDAFLEKDIPSDGILCSNVSLQYDNAPEDPSSGSLQASVTYALVSTLDKMYVITDSLTTIDVKPAGSVDLGSTHNLNLVDGNGNAIPLNDNNVKWVNWEHAYTQMSGFSIIGTKSASKTANPAWNDSDAYAEQAPMNDAQGEYTNQSIFAKDSSGIIKKITGITYRLDRTAPTIENFSVDKDDLVSENSWFSWLFNKKANVKISACDEYKDTSGDTSDSNGFERKVSGLSDNVDNDKVVYYDKHAGENKEVHGFTLNGDDAGYFNFDVDGDQQVDVDTFKAYVTDNAGNTNDGDLSGAKEIPSWVMDLAIDSGHPEISVSYDNNDAHHGSYYNKNRTATFVITMPTFKYLQEYRGDKPIITIYQGDKNTRYNDCVQFSANDFSERSDLGKDKWSVTFTFSQDADYKVLGSVTSLAGYSASLADNAFTIDKTAPVLNVSYDNNNVKNMKYYNASRTATVNVMEHNFDPSLVKLNVLSSTTNGEAAGPYVISDWKTDGDMHTCTISFPQDGAYQIKSISGTDLADNKMADYGDSEFVIDTGKPSISLSVNGEADALSHAYKDSAPLLISLKDTNIDPASTISVEPVGLNSNANPYSTTSTSSATHIDYACESPAKESENDNIYRATIHAIDLAGNEDTKTCEWSVNRFGSVYTVDQSTKDMLDKQYVKGSEASDVKIIEINPSGINQSTTTANISNGVNNTDLQNGSGFQISQTSWDNLPAYNYVIPKENFSNDGTYQITIQSHDLAGNASSNTMSDKNLGRTNSQAVIFSIDNTAPVVSFGGFSEYEIPKPTHDVTIKVEDNIALDKAVVKLSDGSEATLSPEDFDETTHNATITLREAPRAQHVEVNAYDKAGNMDPEVSPNIVVSTNPFVLWSNNPIVVAVTCVVIGLAIVGGAYFFKHRKAPKAE